MSNQLVQQFRLGYKNEDGSKRFLVTWLPVDKRLQVGTVITLQEHPEENWIILDKYPQIQERSDLHKGWDNNIRRKESERGQVEKALKKK